MPSFYGENPPDTEVGSTDATESQVSEDAVTETDTSGGFFQGSPEQTTTEAYEEDARQAKEAAETAQTAAEAAQAAAEASESAASSSESNAASSQTAAATSATNASNSASAAAGSATTASTQASNAASSATAAAGSASNAASSESAAASSETAAASSQTAAAGSATAAASSAGTASTKASEAATSATNAAASESAAASSESNASTSASQAATSATNAASSESAAASSETNAASSASAASTSASNAASSASAASSSATAAASSASSASTSATAAGSARDDAQAALDSFDDRYLGAKSSEPTVDNDGDALVAGALFFDTVNTVMKVYDGSQWLAAYASVSGALLAINNLNDVSNTATARSNLGLGTASEQNVTYFATAAQGALADSALQNGDNVSVLTNDAGYATTTYVDNEVAGLVDSAPATLDTLNELAAALGDDANFSTTVTNSIATKWTQDNTKISNWDTAYGWGDHGAEGYLTGNQTITLTGDVSGSGTTSIAVTIADDSHNHVISNVDGLQTALNAKQDASTALTTSTTFGGDVSGTYNAIVIADDSHNHVISNVDGLQTALDAKQDASTALTTSNYTSTLNAVYANLTGDTFSGNLLFSDSGTTKRGIRGIVGTNDHWFFGGGATASNAGYVEIAAGDDGSTAGSYEPIYVRQYYGDPLTGTVQRTLTLLDNNGNTSVPGDLTLSDELLLPAVHSNSKIRLHGVNGAELIGTSGSTLELSGGSINFNGADGTGTPNLKMAGNTVIDSTRRFFAYGSGTSTTPVLTITNTASTTFNHASQAWAASMTSGQFHGHFFGKEGSTKNAGAIGYVWSSAGSNNNYVSIGHWGADHLLRVHGDGTVNINSGRLDMGGTTVIDSNRNLTNIGTISAGSAGTTQHFREIRVGSNVGATNQTGIVKNGGGTYGLGLFTWGDSVPVFIGGSALNLRTEAGAGIPLQMNGTTVIDASRNLTNIGTISSGAITSSGNLNLTNGNITSSTSSEDLGVLTTNQTNANLYLRSSNASVGNRTNLYFAPANAVATGLLRVESTEDATTTANRSSKMEFWVRENGTWRNPIAIDPDEAVKLSGRIGINGKYDVNAQLAIGDTAVWRIRESGSDMYLMDPVSSSNSRVLYLRNTGPGALMHVDMNGNFRMNGTTVIDGSRNIANVGSFEFNANISTGSRYLARPSNWGYSTSYKAIVLGSASTSYNTSGTGSVTLAFNYDPSVNSNGSFTGDGREIIFRNGTQFVTPNTANTAFNLLNLVLKNGAVGIGEGNPQYSLDAVGWANTTSGYKVGTTTVIDSSRNLTNITTLSVGGSQSGSANSIFGTNQYALTVQAGGNNASAAYNDTLFIRNVNYSSSGVAGQKAQIGFATIEGDGDHHRAQIVAKRDTSGGTAGGRLELLTRTGGSSPAVALTLRHDKSAEFAGNLNVDAGQYSEIVVKGDDNGTAQISLYGDSQGTGRVYVGQSSTYGGGIEYNGDNSPSTTGAGSDWITLYRTEGGTSSWTARNKYSNNDWQFRGNVTAYASDARLKENVTTITDALEKVQRLRGVEFDWKDECAELGFMPAMQHETGVIAQEVQSVIPDAAYPAPFDSEYLTVQKDKIVPLLIEAIKEQQEQIDGLKALIKEMKNGDH